MNNYVIASRYEIFICNAFNCQRGMKNGADVSYMKNFMDLEQGQEVYGTTLEKQRIVVKNYILKAFDAYLQKDFSFAKKEELRRLKTLIEKNCTTSSEFMDIIDKVTELII